MLCGMTVLLKWRPEQWICSVWYFKFNFSPLAFFAPFNICCHWPHHLLLFYKSWCLQLITLTFSMYYFIFYYELNRLESVQTNTETVTEEIDSTSVVCVSFWLLFFSQAFSSILLQPIIGIFGMWTQRDCHQLLRSRSDVTLWADRKSSLPIRNN